jgi:very-short-patch-repair endonuclease
MRGYRVLRFQNEAVHRNLEAVLESLRAACAGRVGSGGAKS